MNTLIKISILLAALMSLSACGGGTTTVYYEDVPEYKLFPVGYFATGYHQDYLISGYDTEGNSYSGNYHVATEPDTYFDGDYSIPVTSTLNINSHFGGSEIMSISNYYSSQKYLRYLNGSENLISGEIDFAEYLYPLPQTAYIGDSGKLGQYISSSGKTVIQHWKLGNAGYDNARLTLTTSRYDAFGQLEDLFEKTFEINQYGAIYSLKLIEYDASSGIYTYLEGVPE